MALISHYALQKPGSPFIRASYVFSMTLAVVILRYFVRKYPKLEKWAACLILAIIMIAITEQSFYLYPETFAITPVILSYAGLQEYYNLLMYTTQKQKKYFNRVIWSYYILRNVSYYGRGFNLDCAWQIIILINFQEQAGKIYDQYIKSIKNQSKMINEQFKNTLDLIPNGVIIVDVNSQNITFANKDMLSLSGIDQLPDDPHPQTNSDQGGAINGKREGASGKKGDQFDKSMQILTSLKLKLANFLLKDPEISHTQPQPPESSNYAQNLIANTIQEQGSSLPPQQAQNNFTRQSSISSMNQQLQSSDATSPVQRSFLNAQIIEENSGEGLFKYLLTHPLRSQEGETEGADIIFKSKNPRKYIQVRTSNINGGQIIAICSDITRIKEFEQQSEKMRSIFFSSVAHELRTPLNSIIPIIQMILSSQESFQLNGRMKGFLEIISNSANHLQNVIEDALDMSRIENKKFSIYKELCDIRQAIKEVADIMQFQLDQKNLKLQIHVKEGVPGKVETDLKRYKQILFNLIGNAVKFTFNGTIKIIVEFEYDSLVTKVEDTGIGITREDLGKLFKFFGKITKTTELNRGGMGLGLTISKMIVQQLGGEISVESQAKRGSVFSFRIPIAAYELVVSPSWNVKPTQEHQMDNFNANKSLARPFATEKQGQSRIEFPSLQDLDIAQIERDDSVSMANISDLDSDQSAIDQKYYDLRQASRQFHSITNQEEEANRRNTVYVKRLKPLTDLNVEEARAVQTEVSNVEEPAVKTHILKENGLKILLVDDSTYNLFILRELLTQIAHHIEIETALNGELAIQKVEDCLNDHSKQTKDRVKSVISNDLNNLVQNSLKPFDIIFLDIHMPLMDGYQTAQKLREMHIEGKLDLSECTIIALSAISENQFENRKVQGAPRQSNQYLFDQFMEKPVNYLALQELIATRLKQIC
ncbi:hypothetical protein FGO68_gene3449 [Halteria grandinella]|uniref:histidine kinase n=1 Tax=Halteria grandinella TaxID=5974 RepID=A0A8J8P4B1_HALGN|nr:hypothetical protein FGO68_gene3449 [Halteria grandinella]